MEPKHSLLRRQLKRQFGRAEVAQPGWEEFVAAVDAAYAGFDEDREMLERSLDLSSQELLAANAKMTAIFEAIPDLLFRVDERGIILSFKAGAEKSSGPPAQLTGRSLFEGPFPEMGNELAVALRRVGETGRGADFEFSVWRHGQEVFHEARFSPLPEGGAIVLVRNITERRRAEAELRAGEERFRLTTLATRDAIYDWDAATNSVWRNETYRQLYTGATSEVSHDVAWWGRNIHPDDRERVTQRLDELRAGGHRLWSAEYRFRRVDGGYARVFDRGYLVYDEAGRPARMIGAMADLTEQKQLQEQVLQAQKMDAVGQLAGGVAHDFNNLLTVILGNLSLLRLGSLGAAEAAGALEQCIHASQRAAELTRQLLTFSRRKAVELEIVDLNGLVLNLTRMLHRLVGEHITIDTTFSPGALRVEADAGMLEQVLMNLVVNSRDAMPRGGRLQIETGECQFDAEDVRRHPQRRRGRFARLRVSDNGSGIPPELLPRVFEPFFTTKEAGKGTGLGLATVFGIVQQHAGWIEVESVVERGTTFSIFLGRIESPEGETPRSGGGQVPLPRGRGEHVLLAEDEPDVRQWIQGVLEHFGYVVHAAGSAVAAWELFARERPPIRLLITDMIMPGGMNGRELADRIRGELPDLKVLLCSGYSQELAGSDALPQRMVFLPKPIEVETLLRTVRKQIDPG